MLDRFQWLLLILVLLGFCPCVFADNTEEEDPHLNVVKLLEEAEQGNAKSQFMVASLYESGKGLEKNKKEALRWYKEAARQGYAEAESTLGYKYEHGELVSKDEAEAMKWYLKASEQDDAWSLSSLGYRKIMGKGTPKDLDEGIQLLHRAGELGEPHAQYYLGICYRDGLGVRVDRIQAYLWLNLAAAQSFPLEGKAKSNREKLGKELIPAQLTEAQQLSSVFVSKKINREPFDARPNLSSLGAGFFISSDGYLLTNHHILEGCKHVTVRTARGVLPAEIIKLDPHHDLALLKVDGKFEALPLGDSTAVTKEQPVKAICFPNPPVSTLGEKLISGKIAELHGFDTDPVYFQTTVVVPPGNSGGPLIDLMGNVIGIAVAHQEAAKTYKISGDLPKTSNYAVKVGFSLEVLKGYPKLVERMPTAQTEKAPADLEKRLEAGSVIVYAWE